MIEYKAEIWNSDTHKYDVIEGSNLAGIYAYLLQNIELTLNKSTANVDDTRYLLKRLGESVVDSDTYSNKLALAQDELNLCLNSYERYEYDEENTQMVNQVVLKQLKETVSLLEPEALDTIFEDLATYYQNQIQNQVYYREPSNTYFKYQNTGKHLQTLYTVRINNQGITITSIKECYNYLVDHLDQLDHTKFTHSVDTLLAAIDDYLIDHTECNTPLVSATRDKITELLVKHKVDDTSLVDDKVGNYLKLLGKLFNDSELELIITQFKDHTSSDFYYNTSCYVEDDTDEDS